MKHRHEDSYQRNKGGGISKKTINKTETTPREEEEGDGRDVPPNGMLSNGLCAVRVAVCQRYMKTDAILQPSCTGSL